MLPKQLPRSWGVVRKLIVVDFSAITPAALAALAGLLLSLGVTYWMMRERDDPLRRARDPGRFRPLAA
jgi:uncharacterized membrane protein (DUF373 family)